MSNDTKTPEQRADDYANRVYGLKHDNCKSNYCDSSWHDCRKGFLDGRASFINEELPKLLEMARDGDYSNFRYSIADLIAMAEKGEV